MRNRPNIETDLILFSHFEAAKKLGVGRNTLGELIKTGRVGVITIGKRTKIPLKEIIKFIDENTMRAEQPKIIDNSNTYTFRTSEEIFFDTFEEFFGRVHPGRWKKKQAAEAAKRKLKK